MPVDEFRFFAASDRSETLDQYFRTAHTDSHLQQTVAHSKVSETQT